MTAKGHVENGVVVLDAPAAFPEGAKVLVSVYVEPQDLVAPPLEAFPPDDPFHGLNPELRRLRGLLPIDFYLERDREAAVCDKLNIV